MTRKKQQSMTLSDEANTELDALRHGQKAKWVGASVLGLLAMAREASRIFDAAPDRLARDLVALTEAVATEFPGTTVLELLADADRGSQKLSLLASLRDLPALTLSEVSAVLVLAYVRGVDPKMFEELVQ